jgi:hypothetical protein
METVAAGTVAGALVQASAIREGVVPPGLEAAVLLVDRIEGTEVSVADSRVKTVMVADGSSAVESVSLISR